MQDEIAAVGAVQRTGLDEREVRDQRAHFRFALHTAQQVAVGGVIFHHHGSARCLGVVHQHVHFVAVQVAFRSGCGLAVAGRKGGFARQEELKMIEYVGAQVGKKGIEGVVLFSAAGKAAGLFRHGRKVEVQHFAGHAAFKVLLAAAEVLFQLGQLADERAHGLKQLVARALEGLALGGFEAAYLLVAEALAVHHGKERQRALLFGLKGEAAFGGHLFHIGHEGGTLGAELFQLFIALLEVGLGIQSCGQGVAHLLEGVGQRGLELAALTGRDLEQNRMIFIAEIVHIDHIGRCGFLAGQRLKEIGEHVGAAEVGRTGEENVVARTAYVQGQFQRGKGAGLSRAAASSARDGAAVFPRDAFGRPAGAELFRSKRGDGTEYGHGISFRYGGRRILRGLSGYSTGHTVWQKPPPEKGRRPLVKKEYCLGGDGRLRKGLLQHVPWYP